MKTENYNPSQIETEFAQAITDLQAELEKKLSTNKIVKVENKIGQDNPKLFIQLEDTDGDSHEIVIKIIQRPDKF